jgi:hypothetical protein
MLLITLPGDIIQVYKKGISNAQLTVYFIFIIDIDKIAALVF